MYRKEEDLMSNMFYSKKKTDADSSIIFYPRLLVDPVDSAKNDTAQTEKYQKSYVKKCSRIDRMYINCASSLYMCTNIDCPKRLYWRAH